MNTTNSSSRPTSRAVSSATSLGSPPSSKAILPPPALNPRRNETTSLFGPQGMSVSEVGGPLPDSSRNQSRRLPTFLSERPRPIPRQNYLKGAPKNKNPAL